jgi:hypothetical protein
MMGCAMGVEAGLAASAAAAEKPLTPRQKLKAKNCRVRSFITSKTIG